MDLYVTLPDLREVKPQPPSQMKPEGDREVSEVGVTADASLWAQAEHHLLPTQRLGPSHRRLVGDWAPRAGGAPVSSRAEDGRGAVPGRLCLPGRFLRYREGQ